MNPTQTKTSLTIDMAATRVYRTLRKVKHNNAEVEEHVSQFFNTLSECSPHKPIINKKKMDVKDNQVKKEAKEVNTTNAQSNFKADGAAAPSKEVLTEIVKKLTTNLTYMITTSDIFTDKQEWLHALKFESECIKTFNTLDEKKKAKLRLKIDKELVCVFTFYKIHSDHKCLYFEMMKIGAEKIQAYLKKYITIPNCKNTGPNNEDVDLYKVPENSRLCVLHMTASDIYFYTMILQFKFNYIYITHRNKGYKEAMKDVVSCKFITVLFTISHADKNQKLTMITFTTPTKTYVIDMLAARIKYLPDEIKEILISPAIAKLVLDEGYFQTYFETKYCVKCVNIYDVIKGNFEMRRNFDANYYPSYPFQFLEEAAESFDNLKIKIENDLLLKWDSRPICKELIDASAKTCFYLFKVACCIKLTYIFLSTPLSEHVSRGLNFQFND